MKRILIALGVGVALFAVVAFAAGIIWPANVNLGSGSAFVQNFTVEQVHWNLNPAGTMVLSFDVKLQPDATEVHGAVNANPMVLCATPSFLEWNCDIPDILVTDVLTVQVTASN
ncbi:MAG TPA: hypothetical protein VJK02_14545 [Anaerolineales bacterium]|nr:hypothetical protein [Anaerolineales bacterium]